MHNVRRVLYLAGFAGGDICPPTWRDEKVHWSGKLHKDGQNHSHERRKGGSHWSRRVVSGTDTQSNLCWNAYHHGSADIDRKEGLARASFVGTELTSWTPGRNTVGLCNQKDTDPHLLRPLRSQIQMPWCEQF